MLIPDVLLNVHLQNLSVALTFLSIHGRNIILFQFYRSQSNIVPEVINSLYIHCTFCIYICIYFENYLTQAFNKWRTHNGLKQRIDK